MCLYANALGRKLAYHSLASADGCMARTISEFSHANVMTLTNSPTTSNMIEFFKKSRKGAYFWHGPFFEIAIESLRQRKELKEFHDGFDIIFEDLGFQMYSPERYEQIEFVKQNLKPGGIMLFYEKLMHRNTQICQERERQKDDHFKAKHFTLEQIQEKKQTILIGNQSASMQANQVCMEELIEAISPHFKYAVLIENSANFYRVVASDDADALKLFVESIVEMPKTQYCYESLPKPLLGFSENELCFREPDNAWFYRQIAHSHSR